MPRQKYAPGWVFHTMGWPLRNEEFGGGFIYNMEGGRVSIGLVIGLDYPDPRVDPHRPVSAVQDAPFCTRVFWRAAVSMPTARRQSLKAAIGRSRSTTSMAD